jgi:hypothetical protein
MNFEECLPHQQRHASLLYKGIDIRVGTGDKAAEQGCLVDSTSSINMLQQ